MNRREAIKRTALLLGTAVSPATITQVLAEVSRDPPSAPRAITRGQFAAMAALAERILPRTDTPGAIDAGVPQFVDVCYGRFMSDEDQTKFDHGITALDTAARRAHQRLFAGLTADQQDAVIADIATGGPDRVKSFLRFARRFIILGYFSSEIVAKEVLVWDPIPGRYDGNQDLAVTAGVAYAE